MHKAIPCTFLLLLDCRGPHCGPHDTSTHAILHYVILYAFLNYHNCTTTQSNPSGVRPTVAVCKPIFALPFIGTAYVLHTAVAVFTAILCGSPAMGLLSSRLAYRKTSPTTQFLTVSIHRSVMQTITDASSHLPPGKLLILVAFLRSTISSWPTRSLSWSYHPGRSDGPLGPTLGFHTALVLLQLCCGCVS